MGSILTHSISNVLRRAVVRVELGNDSRREYAEGIRDEIIAVSQCSAREI